jgi:Domain of unknown function (DUF1996)
VCQYSHCAPTTRSSSLAYPSGGRCPSTHPRALPAISYHLLYKPPADVSSWRLSSDMYGTNLPGGYSLHGDWFNGWDNTVLQTWTQLCVRTPGHDLRLPHDRRRPRHGLIRSWDL